MGYDVLLHVDSENITDLIMAIEAYEGEGGLAFDVESTELDSEYQVVRRGEPTGEDSDGTVDVATGQVEHPTPDGPDLE